MARVSEETIKKLNDFIDSLPEDVRSKCTLCNETLTHLVKRAEVETGAGTATVTRVLSERINDGAAPMDRMSGEALRQRALEQSGEKTRNCSIGTNNPKSKATQTQTLSTKKRPFTMRVSDRYRHYYNELKYYIAAQKKEGWPEDKGDAITESLMVLVDFINQ